MTAFSKITQKFNPRNSLFGRILVWFWVAVTMMVVMSFFIARYFSQSWEVSALDSVQLKRVQVLQQNVQQLLNRNANIEHALKRVSARGKWNLMAINMDSNELVLGFPSPLLTQRAKFLSLKYALQPVLIRTNNMEFVGPFLVASNDQDYQLFVGKLLRRDQRPIFAFVLALCVFLLTGTIACIAIAYTITKPIKRLSKLSKDFAGGNVNVLNASNGSIDAQFKHRKDELGQLHNDIHDMATNLAKSLSQQKALMANISHELRTPLTRLQLALAMLNPATQEQVTYAKRIEKDIGVMDTLIGQALQLAKMGDENQAQWMQSQITDLKTILSPVLEDLEFEAKAKGVTLNVNKYETLSLPLIHTSFISAIENVTRNAIKYSQDDVRITIDLHTSRLANLPSKENDRILEVKDSPSALGGSGTATKTNTMLSIRIEDDGEGLSKQQIAHIFEPFYRAPSGQHFQGTGLGLAIAKAGLQMHRGQIKAQSSTMGGLCLTLLFPIE